MPRYVAFLRGVTPMNLKMAKLKRCFEAAGFTEVRTVLASGNVVFGSRAKSDKVLVREIAAAMQKHLGRTFYTIVRPAGALRELLESDPYAAFRLPANAKRVVTFLGEPDKTKRSLPIEADGVRILATNGSEVFTVYVPGPKGPVFMTMLGKTFGENVTTRTWDTVRKCANA
ncbi:MAG TPA: DUF1697 domain-containing protein [Candidatus Polarisedimenticolia bacterium]|nr:DUF1697 domain-containing protein [Candidatus Polarisedimenticolia bacterium]